MAAVWNYKLKQQRIISLINQTTCTSFLTNFDHKNWHPRNATPSGSLRQIKPKNTCRPKIRHRWKHINERGNDVFGFSRSGICLFFSSMSNSYTFCPSSNHRVWGTFLGCQKIGPKKHQCASDRFDKKHPPKKQTQALNTKKLSKTKKKADFRLTSTYQLLTGLQFFQECLLSVEITSTWTRQSSLTKSSFHKLFLVESTGSSTVSIPDNPTLS